MPLRRIAALLLVAMAAVLSGCGVNAIPSFEEQAKAAWSQVLNQYQRRADLIPNLVETVRASANHERSTLEAVVNARAKATQTPIPADILTNPEAMQQFQQNQGELSSALSRLMVVVERIRISRPTRTSSPCRRSWRAPRTASRWRGAISSTRSASTTPS